MVLDVATDPRLVSLVDGDRPASQHPSNMALQLHTGTNAAYGGGTKPTFLKQLGPEGYRHSDGSVWVKREQRADGKWAFTLRMKQGQQSFVNPGDGGQTQRAEILAAEGPEYQGKMIDERGGDYWFAQDMTFDADMVRSSSMAISGAHDITWRPAPYASYGASIGSLLGNNLMQWKIIGPGKGPSYIYDVRNGPSTTVVGTSELAGGRWGTGRWWKLWNPVADVSIKIWGRIRFGDTAAENPRLDMWRKIGDGPAVKVISNTDLNAMTNGNRYWKTGLYTWDVGSGWWGSIPTRTMRLRSDLWIKNVSSPGRPALDEDVIEAWLDR
jgi:hypothetical protein